MNSSNPLPDPALRCAECGRAFVRDAIVLDDQAYCCLGCLAAGPCICEDAEATTQPAAGTPPVALEIGPFNSQADLMHLAMLLEGRPGIWRVELVVADPRRARFALDAASPASVASAVADIPGYEASVTVEADTVRAIVATRQTVPAEETLLPPRTRFRVFHGGEPVDDAEPPFHP